MRPRVSRYKIFQEMRVWDDDFFSVGYNPPGTPQKIFFTWYKDYGFGTKPIPEFEYSIEEKNSLYEMWFSADEVSQDIVYVIARENRIRI